MEDVSYWQPFILGLFAGLSFGLLVAFVVLSMARILRTVEQSIEE